MSLVTNCRFNNNNLLLISKTNLAKDAIRVQINSTLAKYEYDLRVAANKTTTNSFNNYNVIRQMNEALSELNSIKQTLNESYNSLRPLNYLENESKAYDHLIVQMETIEHTRWLIMICIVSGNMLLIALLLIGLIRNSKGSLCFFAFAGVLSLISIWIMNAIYLGITVFVADFCMSPDHYILTVAERNHIKNCKHSPSISIFIVDLKNILI